MSLITTEVPNLLNGVSQQAESLRFASQLEELVNGNPDPVVGLTDRPPLEHIKRLNTETGEDDAFVHFIDRGAGEQFVMIVTSTDLKIYDLAGNEISVVDEGGTPVDSADLAYVLEANPRDNLKALTVLDYTFILNRNKTTAMSGLTELARDPEALLFVKQARVSTKYTIRLYNDAGGSTPDYTVNYTSSSRPETQADILTQLVTALDAASANSVYSYTQGGPSLYLKKIDDSDFKVEVEAQAPEAFFAFKDKIQNFSLLPEVGYQGIKFLVKGSPESPDDDYYVEYVRTAATGPVGFIHGFWEESVAGGDEIQFDDATMPHALTWDGVKFTFAPITWDLKLVGDDTSNPQPSFIGSKINDIFYYRNRLGLLAGENVVLSENGKFFNFWRTTVLSLLDTDVIDVGATDTSISILRHAVTNSERLVIFSDDKQFIVPGEDILAPRTIRLDKVSDAPNLAAVAPVTVGNFIFAPFNRGSFTGLNQFSVLPDVNELTPTDITNHVPRYISGAAFRLAVSRTEAVLAVLSDGLNGGLYLYRWFDRGKERLQSAWSKWGVGSANLVRGAFFEGSTLYLVVRRDDGTYLEKADMVSGAVDDESTFKVLLDRRVTDAECTLVYDSDEDETTVTLPYTPDSGSTVAVTTRAVSGATAVYALRVKSQSGADVVVPGDQTSAKLWVGQQYSLEASLTRPTLRRGGDATGGAVVTLGRFQVLEAFFAVNDSISFDVTVTPTHGSTYTYHFPDRIVSEGNALVGAAPVPMDTPFRVPVRARSDGVTIKVINSSPFPCRLIKVDYTGIYSTTVGR